MANKPTTLVSVIRTLLIGVRANAIAEAERSTIEFENEVRRLRSTGMSDDEIKRLILADLLDKQPALFGAYRNAIREELAGAVHAADALGSAAAYGEGGADPLLKWTTVGDRNTCEDCQARAGKVKELSLWTLIGLPKSGFSRCGQRCRCELTPVDAQAPDQVDDTMEGP